jgi:glycosyltransferase involved in cell wall biosynthesis
MNIYLYLREFPARGVPLSSGTVKAVHGLAAGLSSCGARVTVVCEGPAEEVSLCSGYTIRCFRNTRQRIPFFIAPTLRRYIAGMEHGLMILNGIFSPHLHTLAEALRRRSIPYIVAPHDPYHPAIFEKNPHVKWPYWYLFERQLLKRAKGIQVLDARHGEWIDRLHIRQTAFETPNGFLPEEVPEEASLGWPAADDARLIFLGRMDEHNKGLDLLLRAFGQLDGRYKSSLALQGPDWGDRRRLERQAAELGLSNRVCFQDADYHQPSARILSGYDIFCLPSRFEGFSLAALEAMLAARVLLISDVAGIAPHVKASGCGVVVQPEAGAIRNGLAGLLERRAEWKEMGLRGRRYALEMLTWKKIAGRALHHYAALVPGLSQGKNHYHPQGHCA